MGDSRTMKNVEDDIRIAEAWLAKSTSRKIAKRYRKRIKRLREELREIRTPSIVTFRVVGRILRETEKAILFKRGSAELWLPKSQITIFEDLDGMDTVEVPEWLAKEKRIESEVA